jgi:hypothetical protein
MMRRGFEKGRCYKNTVKISEIKKWKEHLLSSKWLRLILMKEQ